MTIYRTLHLWWSGHQTVSLEDFAQKEYLFTNLQGNIPRPNNLSDSEKCKSHWKPRTGRGWQLCGQQVMNIKRPSPLRSPDQDSDRSKVTDDYGTQTVMCNGGAIAPSNQTNSTSTTQHRWTVRHFSGFDSKKTTDVKVSTVRDHRDIYPHS